MYQNLAPKWSQNHGFWGGLLYEEELFSSLLVLVTLLDVLHCITLYGFVSKPTELHYMVEIRITSHTIASPVSFVFPRLWDSVS